MISTYFLSEMPLQELFFLEYAGELRIFVLIERISRPPTSSTPHSEPSCEWLRYKKLGFLQVKEHLTTRPTQDKNKETS